MPLNLHKQEAKQPKAKRQLSDGELLLLDFAKRLPFIVGLIVVAIYLNKTSKPQPGYGSCNCVDMVREK